MTGQELKSASGADLLAHGREGPRRTVSPMGCSIALDLLAIPAASVPPGPVTRRPIVVPSADVEVMLDPSWLLDLHDPTLVISNSYVGPDRRRTDRSWDQGRWRPRRWARLIRRAVQVVVMTAAVVVPLVLIASPAPPPATTAVPSAASGAVPAPATVRVHRSPYASRAMTPLPARIDSAAPAAAVPVTSTSPGATARDAAEAQVAQHRAAARAARAAARADRAAARAAARAQARADRLAARAQARADRAAARAAARAARAAARSPHGGRHGVPSVG